MKTLLLIGVLFLAIPAYSETKITVFGELELGHDLDSNKSYADFDLGIRFYFWKCKWSVYGGSLTWFELQFPADKLVTGYPFREIYKYGSRFSIAGFFIQAEHFCNHPVKSNNLHSNTIVYKEIEYHSNTQKWWSNFWGETMTTISIGYEFEFPIWTKQKYQ